MELVNAEALKQYGKACGIEVQIDCQGSVWFVAFFDVVTMDYQHGFQSLIRLLERRSFWKKQHDEEIRRERMVA